MRLRKGLACSGLGGLCGVSGGTQEEVSMLWAQCCVSGGAQEGLVCSGHGIVCAEPRGHLGMHEPVLGLQDWGAS